MMILLALVAVGCGITATAALWPFGPILALLAAPFVTSAVVIGIAFVLAARSAKSTETEGDRWTSSILHALTKLMTR